ncbi:MAG: FliM/FliN family flagellar motor switch protein [Steroidobacter sp.]
MTGPIANEIELEPLAEVTLGGKPLLTSVLPFLGSVKVRVSVRVGEAEASVAELLTLERGSVLVLDRLVDQPLDVVVDEHVIARGMLVAMGESFGISITETASLTGGKP